MSDGAAAAPLWMPADAAWAGLPVGAKAVMLALIIWRDGRGSCDPTEADLAALTGMNVSTVRKHAKTLAKEGAEWAKRERRRREDNSLDGYRYWLVLEKLGLGKGDRSNPAVALPVDSAADTSPSFPEATAGIERSPPEPTAGIERSGPLESSGLEKPGARVRARVLSNPISPSFAFRDAEQKGFMEAVAAVCGVGLCRFDECEGLTDSLAIAMDKWLVAGFDADLDIVPTLKRITAHARAKPVYDFGVEWITKDIRDHREARLSREAKRAAKAAGGDAPKPSKGRGGFQPKGDVIVDRNARAEILRRSIARIERGEVMPFDLPHSERRLEGHWRDDAIERELQRQRDELAALGVAETADGRVSVDGK